MTYRCKVLIVDDSAKVDASTIPSGIECKVVQTIRQALETFDPKLIPTVTAPEIASNSVHNFDIVFLDYQLTREDMLQFPSGGLSLAPVFKAFASKPWPCLVVLYSTYLAGNMPSLLWLTRVTEYKTRNLAGKDGNLVTAGIGDIPWERLLVERGQAILRTSPPPVLNEVYSIISDVVGSGEIDCLWTSPIQSLAEFMEVDAITLRDLFHLDGEVNSNQIWSYLTPFFSSRSKCSVLWEIYRTEEMEVFTHVEGVAIDLETSGVLATGDTFSLKPRGQQWRVSQGQTRVPYDVPRELYASIKQINEDSRRGAAPYVRRTADAKSAFRMVLSSKDEGQGRPIPLGWQTEYPVEGLYLYIPQAVLANLLSKVQGQVKGPFDKCGPVVSQDTRFATFFFVQTTVRILPLTVENAIRSRQNNGIDSWGPFPTILEWGMFCVTDENGSGRWIWPGGVSDATVSNLRAPKNSLGLVFPIFN